MSVTVTLLHAHPQTRVDRMIRDRLARCREAQIVSGFATPDGIDALRISASAGRISRLVLGAATFQAFEALDTLIGAGLSAQAARVHLGHTRKTGGRKHPFARMRPMLHSKVLLFDMADGLAAALVGSHNLTGFALRGLNGEAGLLIEGRASEPVFADLRAHVAESFRQAVPYDTTMKEAYARWYADYLDQLRIETGAVPREGENRRTIILLAEAAPGARPGPGQRIYFELDRRIEEVKDIETEVHLHLFPHLPSSPSGALVSLQNAATSLVGNVEAIDSGAGSAEVKADWFIGDSRSPVLTPTSRPFRPTLSPGKQQVRAQIGSELKSRFEYRFEREAVTWEPLLGPEVLTDEAGKERWSPVVGFEAAGRAEPERKLLPQREMFEALPEMSPDSGSFILFSRKRIRHQ